MHNQDIVTLTFLGRRVVEGLVQKSKPTMIGDDIIFYLYDAPKSSATCEELGMNIKATELQLSKAIDTLEKGGYVTINHLQEFRSMGPGYSEYEHHSDGEMVYEHEEEE